MVSSQEEGRIVKTGNRSWFFQVLNKDRGRASCSSQEFSRLSTKPGKVPEGRFWPKMVKICSNFLCMCEHGHGQLRAYQQPEPRVCASTADIGRLIHGSPCPRKDAKKKKISFKCSSDLCMGKSTSFQLVLVPVLSVQD